LAIQEALVGFLIDEVVNPQENIIMTMPVVFIHYPYSNPHPPQMGRV
jgi:hypothetical protein